MAGIRRRKVERTGSEGLGTSKVEEARLDHVPHKGQWVETWAGPGMHKDSWDDPYMASETWEAGITCPRPDRREVHPYVLAVGRRDLGREVGSHGRV